MIHSLCGILNPNFPCMVDGKCSKRYRRQLVAKTITGNDDYPLYLRRSTDDNEKSTIIIVNQQDIEIYNHWVVSFSPLLSKTFKAHINVEFCYSVKSIKDVNKGSDMGVLGVAAENSNDEITQFQMGCYVSIIFYLLYIKDIPLLFTWPYFWKIVKEFILQRRIYYNKLTARHQQH